MTSETGATTNDVNEIPKEMKRLVVTSPGKGTSVADCTIVVETVPTPVPQSGEVLVKVVAAPINPSDYGSWYRGNQSKAYPMMMGKEGSGIVVVSGGGLTTLRCPVGTNVGISIMNGKQGTYSEYVTVNATSEVFPMPKNNDNNDFPIEDCASFLVNPFTALAILDTAKKVCGKNEKKVIVHTAAASQLGQMMNKLAPSEGVEIINVVRREEQAELLRGIGAKHIVVTGGDEATTSWKEELKGKIDELGATCVFDAVAGSMTGDLMDLVPYRGVVYVYGGLAGPVQGINPMDLIYKKKQLKGWILTDWIMEGGLLYQIPRMMSCLKKVTAGIHQAGWSSSQFTDTTLELAQEDIVKLTASSITGKKLRIRLN